MYTACHPIEFEPMETKLPPLVFTGCAFKSQLRVIPGFGGARRVTLYGSNVDRSDTKESFFTPAPICLVIDVADDGISWTAALWLALLTATHGVHGA